VVLTKLALVPEVDEYGQARVLPFRRHGEGLEKLGSLPDGLQRYVETYQASDGRLALLVVAMGALEAWGSNANADAFDQKCLVHLPDGWADDPERDRTLASGWGWGYPTFYNASVYSHHSNKTPERAIGDISYVGWDPKMMWVLVVVLLDPKRAKKFGGQWVIDRVGEGRAIPFSMGCRVPYDLLSTTPDWDHYEKALASYDPAKHRDPAQAVLAYHDKVHHIYGLSRTRKDYPDECLYHMNEVKPDGRKIYVYNDFPRFFDFSAVAVPADQVAWTVLKLGSHCLLSGTKCAGRCVGPSCKRYVIPGAVLDENMEGLMDKAASAHVASLGKGGTVRKAGDIDKQVTSPVQSSTALPRGEKGKEPDLPKGLLDRMGRESSLDGALSTPTCMGMLLKPHEFRRVVLVHVGKPDLADKLDERGKDLPASLEEASPGTIGPAAFDDTLRRLLEPFLGGRSWLGPMAVKRMRITIVQAGTPSSGDEGPELETQRKVSALYNGYRKQASAAVEHARSVVAQRPDLRASLYGFGDLAKHGGIQVSGTLAPLVTQDTRDYFRDAYRTGGIQ